MRLFRPRNASLPFFLRTACALLIAGAGAASAALPPAIDGQALPSLAPMLEHVTPAVVNINSKTRVRVRDPFFDDPMFRRFFGIPNGPRSNDLSVPELCSRRSSWLQIEHSKRRSDDRARSTRFG